MDKCGELRGSKSKVWKDKNGVDKILAFAELADQCHMRHDNAMEDSFTIIEWDNDIPEFERLDAQRRRADAVLSASRAQKVPA